MRKKYLSRILLGGLIIASTVTLNSCKDYDDDIDDLQSQIDANSALISANATAIDALEAEIAAGSVISSVTSSDSGITITLSNGSSYTITNGEDGEDGENYLWTIGDDGYWYLNGDKTEYQATGEDGADGGYYYPGDGGYFIYVASDGTETLTDIAWQGITTGITAAYNEKEGYIIFSGLATSDGGTTTYILYTTSALKSIVFSPYLYWNGIEAIDVAYLNYEELGLDAVDADGDYSADAPYSLTSPATTITIAPLVTAEYHLNPSNANVETDASYYSYKVNHAETRSTLDDSDIEVKSVENNSGVIEVSFKIQDAGVAALLANDDDEIDVAALQYTTTDTIITSDFAALYIEEVTLLNINCASEGNVDTEDPSTLDQHLAETAADAISDYENATGTYPVLTVEYDETINLDEYINVHKGCTSADGTLWGGQATLAKSDFYMTYELVGWIHGSNSTSESVHAELLDKDGDGIYETLDPTGYDGAAEITTAGRAPLVRVTLWDNNDSSNKHIAAVGYIIVEISEESDAVGTTIKLTDEYIVKCADEEVTTTWSDVEKQLYTLVGMSKTSFEATYSLVTNTSGEAIQYSSSYAELTTTDYIGVVTITTSDNASTQTNVLQWAITQEEAYEAFVTNGQSSVVTYVKFESLDASDPDIYVELVWAPSNAVVKKQTISVVTSSTVSYSYWYANNSGSHGTNEVHWKIGQPTTSTDTSGDFDNVILDNTFLTTPLATITSTYSAYTELIAYPIAVSYYFVASTSQDVQTYTVDGTVYTVNVEYDLSNTTIGVTDTSGNYYELAEIVDTTTGEIEVTSNASGLEVFEAIINSRTQDALSSYLTFTLGLSVETCDPAGTDFITITDQIDVVVLSPLFVTEAETSTMQWDVATTLEDQTVVIEVTDYNGYNYKTFDAVCVSGASDMIDYYGITSIELDVDNATTNFATGSSYIAVNSTDFTLTYTAATVSAETDSSGAYTGNLIGGTITLTQNSTATSQAFTIKIPLTVTYDWGEVESTYVINVQSSPTTSTGAKRK